jgi:hypothetical protein
MATLKYLTGCFVVMLLVMVPIALGQTSKGFVVGTINDPNGAAVPGATIKVTNTATGVSRETKSQEDGHLSFRCGRPRNLQTRRNSYRVLKPLPVT